MVRGVRLKWVCCSTPPSPFRSQHVRSRPEEEKSFIVTVLVKKNFLFGFRSPAASNDNTVSLSKFRMLTRWYRVGSFSFGLNNIPLVLDLRLPLLRRHFVNFQRFACDLVPTFHGLVRAADFLHALAIICILFPSIRTTRAKFFICACRNFMGRL